jgi:uncharacterized membrane protein (UPF0127 family)
MTARLTRLPQRRLPGGRLVAVADSRPARARGLAGLAAIDPGEALLLPACRSVHTVGMAFALDLIWLDARDRPIRTDRDVPPGRVRTCLRARAVIETRAGAADGFLAEL